MQGVGEDGGEHGCLTLELIFFAEDQNLLNGFPISGLWHSLLMMTQEGDANYLLTLITTDRPMILQICNS